MITRSNDSIRLLIKFIHIDPDFTFYLEDKVHFFTDKISCKEVLDEIVDLPLEDISLKITGTKIFLDTDRKNIVFITIVATYDFDDIDDTDTKVANAVVRYITDTIWNKTNQINDNISFEKYYQEILAGDSNLLTSISCRSWYYKK